MSKVALRFLITFAVVGVVFYISLASINHFLTSRAEQGARESRPTVQTTPTPRISTESPIELPDQSTLQHTPTRGCGLLYDISTCKK